MLNLVLTVLLLLWTLDASATRYWVSTTGSDANACSAVDGDTDPGVYKLTPLAGCACLTAGGDRLTIKAGTYTGNSARIFPTAGCSPPDGSSGNPTIIEGEGSAGCALTSTCGTILRVGSATSSDLENPDWVTLRLLDIDDTSHSAWDSCLRIAGTGSNVVIEDVEVHNCQNNGFQFGNAINGVRMTRVHAHHAAIVNTPAPAHGGYISSPNLEVGYSSFHDNGPGGTNSMCLTIYVEGSPQADNSYVHHSSFFNCDHGLSTDGDDGRIFNNLIYNNAGDGLDIGWDPSSKRTKVSNNLIYNNGAIGVHVGHFGDADDSELSNNHIIGNTPNITIEAGSTGVVQTTNRTTGSVTDCTNTPPDFTPKASSSCENAGTTVAAVTDDFIGTPRPQGAAYDIGPYEVLPSGGGSEGGQSQSPTNDSPRVPRFGRSL